MQQSRAAHSGSIEPLPSVLRWLDPDRRLSLEIKPPLLVQLADIAGATPINAIGLLLGSCVSAPERTAAITDIALLATQPTRAIPPSSPQVRQQISRWAQSSTNSSPATGLFLVHSDRSTVIQASDFIPLSQYFTGWVPVIVLSNTLGLVSGNLYIWSPADCAIYPTILHFPLSIDVLAERDFLPFSPGHHQTTSEASDTWAEPPVTRSGRTHASSQRAKMPGWPIRNLVSRVLLLSTGALLATPLLFLIKKQSNKPAAMPIAEIAARGRQEGNLGLEVTRRGGDLNIRWNRTTQLMQEARSGRIAIRDNDRRIEVPLDVQQLTSGQILYGPRSSDVEVTFAVMTASGPISESVRVIQPLRQEPDTWAVLPSAPQANNAAPVDSTKRQVPVPATDSRSRVESSASRGVQRSEQPQRMFQLPPNSSRPSASGLGGPRLDGAPSEQAEVPPSLQLSLDLRGKLPTTPPLGAAQPSPPPPHVEMTSPASKTIAERIVPSAPIAQASDSQLRVITPPVLIGKAIINPLPTALWRMIKNETEMKLKLLIDDKGRITQIQPIGSPAFANVVSSFVQQDVSRWRYEPARLNGKPVPSEQNVTLSLRPGDNKALR